MNADYCRFIYTDDDGYEQTNDVNCQHSDPNVVTDKWTYGYFSVDLWASKFEISIPTQSLTSISVGGSSNCDLSTCSVSQPCYSSMSDVCEAFACSRA